MNVRFWGTRGSLASPGPETERYGGNTSCVEVRGEDGTLLALDAGTGIRRLGMSLPKPLRRIDILLSHLHMDHIQGLGFFAPLYNPETEVHIWGPASPMYSLRHRLMRYLSPPLFPVHLRDLPRLILHEVRTENFEIGEFRISALPILHPDMALGYRVADQYAEIAYMSDHEPLLGQKEFPADTDWISGFAIAAGVDMLIHDAQYTQAEYESHVGWGHSSLLQAIEFARVADAKCLVPFHYDPIHSDDDLDRMIAEAIAEAKPTFPVQPAHEGKVCDLGPNHSKT